MAPAALSRTLSAAGAVRSGQLESDQGILWSAGEQRNKYLWEPPWSGSSGCDAQQMRRDPSELQHDEDDLCGHAAGLKERRDQGLHGPNYPSLMHYSWLASCAETHEIEVSYPQIRPLLCISFPFFTLTLASGQ